MKEFIITMSLLLSLSIANAQKYQVLTEMKQEGNTMVVNAINTTSVQHEVTITMEVKNYKGYRKPITKLVKANDTLQMVRLTPVPNKRPEVSYTYQFVAKPTDAEFAEQNKKLEKKKIETLGNIDQGIILFYQDGCPRCSFATTYMLENNIDFRMMDVTDDAEKNQALWKLIYAEKPELKEFVFPVFLVNGKLSYSIEDLAGFTADLDIFKIKQ